jgi:hypothetical protein
MQDQPIGNYQKKFRRKRKHRGVDWAQGDPPTLQDVHRGVWCRRCHKRHPYNGHGRLKTEYEKRGEAWVLLWVCPVSGDVVGELYTGDKNFGGES